MSNNTIITTQTYRGTFVKINGESRSMRFIRIADLPTGTISESAHSIFVIFKNYMVQKQFMTWTSKDSVHTIGRPQLTLQMLKKLFLSVSNLAAVFEKVSG